MTLTYEDALNYLYSLTNYELKRPEQYTPEVISLERPRALMAALGNPQETYPIIHVTGTKGKGSGCSRCASVLTQAGLRVGLYTSPHLQDFRERFRINGEMIKAATLAAYVERIKPFAEKISGLTWFEITTALAFLYFADANVDIAVIEVGLGGRLDATNAVRHPLVSTITSLSYDHMDLLGHTMKEIATEKAGIIKMGCPVVSAPQPQEGQDVIEAVAAERRTSLTLVGRHVAYRLVECNEKGQTIEIDLTGSSHSFKRYWLPLIGEHQVINAAVALATLQQARQHPKIAAALTEKAIRDGLQFVNWSGIVEVVRRQPWFILDVAHNGASAEYLAATIRANFRYQKLIVVFGAFTDKDVTSIFKALLPHVSYLILTETRNPRAFSPQHLAEIAITVNYTGTTIITTHTREALSHAEMVAQADDLVCFTGSLSLVGEIRDLLGLVPAHATYLSAITDQTQQENIL